MRKLFGWAAALLTAFLTLPVVVQAADTVARNACCCPGCPFCP